MVTFPQQARLKRWGTFYELNPSLCTHPGVVAGVTEEGAEQTGVCMYCDRRNITEDMQRGFPKGEPFTVVMSTDAQTTEAEGNFTN
jgi:hypothetical protein